MNNAQSYITTGITLALMAIAAEVTYIVIGPEDITADVTLEEPAIDDNAQCGNGVLDAGEQCDDGNEMVFDGCTRCKTEAGFLCIGSPSLCGPFDGFVSSMFSSASSASSSASSESSSLDMSSAASSITSRDTSSSSAAASSSSVEQSSAAAASAAVTSQPARYNQRAVRAPYSSSTATQTADTQPKETGIKPSCGDELVFNEGCDDGNTADGDGCSATCTPESGYICTGNPSTCAIACGDGVIMGEEKCDDGGNNNGDGCNANCKIEAGHSCKGSPSICTVQSYCGDGVTEGLEACDDANSIETDGCTSTCKKAENGQMP